MYGPPVMVFMLLTLMFVLFSYSVKILVLSHVQSTLSFFLQVPQIVLIDVVSMSHLEYGFLVDYESCADITLNF